MTRGKILLGQEHIGKNIIINGKNPHPGNRYAIKNAANIR